YAPRYLPPAPKRVAASSAQVRSGEEFDGVRAYQTGDPLLVIWKKQPKPLQQAATSSSAVTAPRLFTTDSGWMHAIPAWQIMRPVFPASPPGY
ncbi:hypothetical protein J4714_14060, partial [Staphylococcus epidermidis]|nr:hypothetical protein [Staphylococcus epidermidis]